MHLKKHRVRCYCFIVFYIFLQSQTVRKKTKTKPKQTAYKKRNFIFGGLLFTIWFGRGNGSWQKIDLSLEKGKELKDKCSKSLDCSCLSFEHSHTDICAHIYRHAHPLSCLCNTEESWQNGRKHAQSGQGRILCQQPRTIKGVKVLPSLNCSRSAKWEPKLSTSFSAQNCLNLLCCNTPDRESFEKLHQEQ